MYLSQRQDQPPDGENNSLSLPLTATASDPTTSSSASPTTSASSLSTSSPDSGTSSSTYIVAIVITVVAVLIIAASIFFVRRAHIQNKKVQFLPTRFLKGAWSKWESKASHDRLPDSDDNVRGSHEDDGDRQSAASSRPRSTTAAPSRNAPANRNSVISVGVDRNTSIRSVMTLPPYNLNASQNEQIIAREGERGGVDTVVEFPETIEEAEDQREEEMEALYQVRLARRRENEEREERRTQRREARERGDFVALRELANRPRGSSGASGERTVIGLRAEHERIKKRQRAVSSVSYADLGVARHDGTRILGSSDEGERQGLLGDAASFAASSHYHRRDRSDTSVLSIETSNSDNLPSPGLRSRGNSQPQTPLRTVDTNDSNREGQAGSSPEMIEHEDVPLNSPPGYENISLEEAVDRQRSPPPDYTSPILDRGESRPTSSSTANKRASHIGHLYNDRRASASCVVGETRHSTIEPLSAPAEAPEGWQGIGVPRLPSLRLGGLPSIQVDPSSPIVGKERERTIEEEDHHHEV